MKYFFLLMLITSPIFAQPLTLKIDKVRSLEHINGEAVVTFWGTNQVFRLPANSSVLPCLDTGFKARKEVVLGMNKDTNVIAKCKLYGGGIPKN